MPLSPPAAREALHHRRITLEGFGRPDGQIEVEAHLVDTKTFMWANHDRGAMPPGAPMHDMWMRVTVDEGMTITAVEVAMDATPHDVCPGVAPNYQRLVGLNISKGFLKAAMAVLGGTAGCTHLRELLQQVGTVAFQTTFSQRIKDRGDRPQTWRVAPALVDTCYAYGQTGPLVMADKTASA
jgi:hypothetical protein